MAKIVPFAGVFTDTALVSLGWLTFVMGTLTPDPLAKAVLMAMARVLPKALHFQWLPFIGANLRCSSCISPVLTCR